MKTATCISFPLGAWLLTVAVAAAPIQSCLQDLKSPLASVRIHAARSLGTSGSQASVPALIDTLNDSAPAVRREAAKALASLKDLRATPRLMDALEDPDGNVRMYAAYALGEIKAPEAVDRLVGALSDPEWCVRDQAAWALREIGEKSIIDPLVATLQTSKADEEQVLWILRSLDTGKTADYMGRLLASGEPATRLRAVRALARLQTPQAIAPLIRALRDTDSRIRSSAVVALAGQGDRRAAKPLLELAAREEDPDLRDFAERAALELSIHEHLDAYWSFDNQSTSVAKDVTHHGNDGEIRGAVPVEGKVGYALRFGPGKFIELGRPAGLSIGNVPFTLMAWVKSEAASGVVVARGGAFCGYSLYVMDGLPKFGIHRMEEGPTYIAASTDTLGNSWRHLAGVVKKDRIELYVDGRLAATAETAGYIPGDCGQGMEIGFDAGNSPAEIVDPFHGIIDEIKIFRAALSAEEIVEEAGLKSQETTEKS